MGEYIVEWEFDSEAEAVACWHKELPKGYKPTGAPTATRIPSPFGGDGQGWRVVGEYYTLAEGH